MRRVLLLVKTEVALQPAENCASSGTIQWDFGSLLGPGAVSDQPNSSKDQNVTVVYTYPFPSRAFSSGNDAGMILLGIGVSGWM